MVVQRDSRSAFTIVELLVAAAITVIIVVMLGTMFASLISTSSRAGQRIDAFRDARAALQMMERDLSGLVRARQTAYFAFDKRWQPGGTDPADPYADQASSNPNHQLFALVSAKNQPPGKAPNEIGNICAVGYYCHWEGDRYTLRRFFRDSVDVYNAIRPQLSGNTLNYTPASLLYTPVTTDDTLGSYIWNLQITAYKADGTVDTTYPLVMDPGNAAAVLPAAIEISFNAMSPDAARTVVATQAPASVWMLMDDTDPIYKNLIKPHTYAFHTRINF
jgi:type II secretory pathway pseudopilin PulG